MSLHGIICINKPTSHTSFDIVAIMRKVLNTKKIGHSGTLDPMAEGVLPVFVGNATKAIDFCPCNEKVYRAGFRLGMTTTTQDSTGEVLTQADCQHIRRENFIAATEQYIGEIEQLPPMYSAVKVKGKRLYDLARKGITVERTPRKVTVHSIAIEEYDNGAGTLLIRCKKGTYIRTLIHDIGLALGVGAMMTTLVRTESNGFTLNDCYTLDQLRNAERPHELLFPFERLFNCYPTLRLDERRSERFATGAKFDLVGIGYDRQYDGIFAVYNIRGNFVALGTVSDENLTIIQRFAQK